MPYRPLIRELGPPYAQALADVTTMETLQAALAQYLFESGAMGSLKGAWINNVGVQRMGRPGKKRHGMGAAFEDVKILPRSDDQLVIPGYQALPLILRFTPGATNFDNFIALPILNDPDVVVAQVIEPMSARLALGMMPPPVDAKLTGAQVAFQELQRDPPEELRVPRTPRRTILYESRAVLPVRMLHEKPAQKANGGEICSIHELLLANEAFARYSFSAIFITF